MTALHHIGREATADQIGKLCENCMLPIEAGETVNQGFGGHFNLGTCVRRLAAALYMLNERVNELEL